MDRAYSLLSVKNLDADERTFVGTATTPSLDRVGDSVDPLGVKFTNPLPLLWAHDHTLPIGTVKFDKPTKAGITFHAKIAKATGSAVLDQRCDEAWASVKAGIARAVSIGFRALDGKVEALATGGLRFKAVEVLELSIVVIPANQDCTITAVKRWQADAVAPRVPTPLEIIDAEIAEARERAKALEADEADAAHRLQDTRWRAVGEARARLSKRMDEMETKRAAIMAGEQAEEPTAGKDGLTKRELMLAELVMKLLLKSEIYPLEDRVKALEARPELVDAGVWVEGKSYRPGNAVSFGGSLWIAQRATAAKPDTPDSGFRLAVKKGRDGKDARG